MELNAGRLGAEVFQSVLSDHVSWPGSICNHPSEELPVELQVETVASVICRLGTREMWVTYGQPCSNPYLRLQVPAV